MVLSSKEKPGLAPVFLCFLINTMTESDHSTPGLEVVQGWLHIAQRVLVLTGAGLSTASGIPDFRGPQGVWTRDPDAEKLSDIRYYLLSLIHI